MNLAANDPHDYRSTVCLLVADAEDDAPSPSTRCRSADSERSTSSRKNRTDQPALRSGGQVNNEPIGGDRFGRFSATAGDFTDVADTNSRCNEPTQNGSVSRKGQGS
jgi:hypothetical protein